MSTCLAISLYIVFSWQGRTLCMAIYSASSLEEIFFVPSYAITRVNPSLLFSPIFFERASSSLICCSILLIFLSYVRPDCSAVDKIYEAVPER